MSTPPPGVDPGPAPDAVPVCPRHPDRVSYVRCQRCGRPACPECQRQAAVGVHCVDCVRASSRTAPVARTAFGAPLRGGPPVVTMTLVGLSVASFLLQLLLGRGGDNPWTQSLLFVPAWGAAEPWRFLTAAFLHSTGRGLLLHIGFNMYALWIFGPGLEQMLGRWRFLALYLVAAVGGSVAFTLLATPGIGTSWTAGVVGASGAVFGLFGAMFVLLRRLGRDVRGMVALLLVNAALPFVVGGIAWEAHLGGFVVGLGLGAAFAYAPKERRAQLGVVAVAGTLAVLVAAVAVRYATVNPLLLL
ncbi:rhomboid family intramembrane serine protease [Cellulomonas carbonis]|uniref:Protease n=1 Tax=Cellulomonas carbonis T26 TaxID=947969 RepID=A0A0A0BYR8_9CELL|nr:rhomboid family intramembrane serine protease [Cellulomonas carbonis]KGM12279.1 protease [Cellulomonas carbonis T26]GGC01305.1 rhomboid family intramembrane serine protease [Cellulomonas carbonis]